MVPDLPDSDYAPAKMDVRSIEAGIVKYFHDPKHVSFHHLCCDLVIKMKLNIDPLILAEKINKRFDEHFPLLDLFMEEPLPLEVVKDLALHSINGSLRSATSAGIGFKKDRKAIVRDHPKDFEEIYNYDCYDLEIFWKIFLKDELREKIKKTRSIAVGQLHLWIIGMKWLGGLYFYYNETKPRWSGFGMDDKAGTWTEKFSDWDFDAMTYGFDIKGQDSKMSPAYVDFWTSHKKRVTPQKAHDALEWVVNQSFYDKKLVDYMGRVLSFAPGEMSGHFLTIIMNTEHNLFLQVQHEVCTEIYVLQNNLPKDLKFKILLGDDDLLQTKYPELLEDVADLNGHELTKEKGGFFEVSFLSCKLAQLGSSIVPYYCNLDKMYASLCYTTGGNDEYFQKCCSFTNLLLFAPEGSLERKWRDVIYDHSKYMLKVGQVTQDGAKCFKTLAMLERARFGYQ